MKILISNSSGYRIVSWSVGKKRSFISLVPGDSACIDISSDMSFRISPALSLEEVTSYLNRKFRSK